MLIFDDSFYNSLVKYFASSLHWKVEFAETKLNSIKSNKKDTIFGKKLLLEKFKGLNKMLNTAKEINTELPRSAEIIIRSPFTHCIPVMLMGL